MGSLLRAQAEDTEQNMGNQRRQKTLHSKTHHEHQKKKVMYVIFFTNQGLPIQIAVLKGKLPVPGRPKIWMIVGQGPIALAVGAVGGCLDIFLSSITSLFFLPVSGRRPDID